MPREPADAMATAGRSTLAESANGTILTFRLTLDSRGDKASPMRRGTSATEGAWQNRGSPSRSKDETGSRQLVEQRLGILQDRRVETFGEPAVDWREQITGFGAFALVTPKAAKAGVGAQLEKLCTLPLRYRERLMVTLLGRGKIACSIQQIASQPMQISFVTPLFSDL